MKKYFVLILFSLGLMLTGFAQVDQRSTSQPNTRGSENLYTGKRFDYMGRPIKENKRDKKRELKNGKAGMYQSYMKDKYKNDKRADRKKNKGKKKTKYKGKVFKDKKRKKSSDKCDCPGK
jgi:hypothetical protein